MTNMTKCRLLSSHFLSYPSIMNKNKEKQISKGRNLLDPLRKDPSESPAQFATRALSQLEEGLRAHKAKYGNLRHPRPEELK